MNQDPASKIYRGTDFQLEESGSIGLYVPYQVREMFPKPVGENGHPEQLVHLTGRAAVDFYKGADVHAQPSICDGGIPEDRKAVLPANTQYIENSFSGWRIDSFSQEHTGKLTPNEYIPVPRDQMDRLSDVFGSRYLLRILEERLGAQSLRVFVLF